MANQKRSGSSDLRKTKSQLIQEIERLRRELDDAQESSGERKYQDLTEGSLQGYYIQDNFRILSANQALADMFGYGAVGEVLALDSLMDLVAPHAHDRAKDFNARRRAGEDVPTRFEIEGVRKDGSVVWCEMLSRLVEWEGQAAVQSTVIDVTERKQTELALLEEIAERKRAEESLRDNKTRLQNFIDSSPSNLAFIDRDLLYRQVNAGYLAFVGKSEEEVIGHTVAEVVGEEAFALFRPWIEESLQGRKQHFEVSRQLRDLGVRDLEVRYVPIFDPQGRVLGFHASVQDITERKRAEDALRESEERFRTLVEHAPEAITMLDVDTGLYVDANPKAEALHRLPRDELIGKIGPADLSPKIQLDGRPSSEAAQDYLNRALTGEFPKFEWMHLAQDGQETLCEVSLARLPNPHRNLVRASISDITERKRMEEALKNSERIMKKAEQMAHFGSLELDIVANSQYWSDEIWRIMGLEPQTFEPTDKAFADLLDPEDKKRVLVAMNDAVSSDKPFDIECRVVRPDGTKRILHALSEVIRDESGRPLRMTGTLQDITERKRAEEELRESQRLLQTVFDTIPHWVYVKDRNSRYMMVNKAMADTFNLQPKDFQGAFTEEFRNKAEVRIGTPDELKRLEEMDRQVFETGALVVESEFNLSLKDGSKRIHRIIKLPILNDAGAVRGVVGISENITEHKRAKDALQESEEKFRNLIEGSILGLIIHTDKLLFANQAAATLFGYDDPEEMQELETIEEIFSPEDRESMAEKREARMQGVDVPNQYEFQGLRKDGSSIWLETHVRIVNWEGQKAIQCTYSDISERKRAEEELRESEERFKSIFDNSPSLILLKDVEGRFLLVSDRHEEWHGIPAEDMIGKTANDLFTRETADNMWAQDQEVLRTGQVSVQEQEVSRLDGSTIRVVITKFPVRNGEGVIVGIGTIANNVTDQRILEAQLRESQKMEAVGQLAGGIAHDFNNLLQIINSYAHMELNHPGGGEKSRKHIQKIIEAGERAANLTRQLLTFSRKTVLRQTSLDFNGIISNLIKMVGRIIGEDIELNFTPGDPLYPVWADPGMIEQVVLNLCVNARDAMPGGGRLDLSTRNLVADRELCDSLGLEHPGSYIMLEVRDTGTGMTGEVREHIFEPFFTTKEVGKGTGLGLSIAHGIIQQHQGAIDVRSEPGEGTTFTIYLSVAEAKPLTDEKKAPMDSKSGRETILVAEDEAEVRELLSDLLRSQGYHVLAASDGREAIDLFRDESASIDLAILDVVMPKLKGPEVHDYILQMRPEVPVVFSTGYSDQAIDAEYQDRHDITLIQKPYSPDSLFSLVREILDRTG